MKILIYVPNMIFDSNTGDSIHVRELAQNLSKLGCQITVLCRLKQKSNTGEITIKRVIAPNIRIIGYLLATTHGLFSTLAASRKYDIIYTRSGFAASARVLSWLSRIPFIVEINGLIRDEATISSARWLKRISGYILDSIEGKAYKYSLHLVAVTPQIKEALIKDYGLNHNKITVIPNGANTDLFRPIDTAQARAQLHLSQADCLVTFSGNIVAWQGVRYLIESIPHVIKENPKASFLIIGDGPLKSELIDFADNLGVLDKVIFAGRVPYEKVPLYLNASDVCVAPFIKGRNERCGLSPLKIHEYMACGKPIISTRIGNLDAVEKSNAGILVEPENAQELGNAIIRLLKDERLRQRMGENGRSYVVKNHSWESTARKVVTVCELALAHKHGGRP